MKNWLMGIVLIICGCSSAPQPEEGACRQNSDGQHVVDRTHRENARAFSDGGQEKDVNLELGRRVASLERELEEARDKAPAKRFYQVEVFCFGTRPNRREQLWITPLDQPGQSSRVVSLLPLLNAKPDACGFYRLDPTISLEEGRYQVDNYRGNRFAYRVAPNMKVGEAHQELFVITPKGRRFKVPCESMCIVLVPSGYSFSRTIRENKSG